MKVFVCKYGKVHLQKKCTCDRLNKKQLLRPKYVLSEEIKNLSSGEYKVVVGSVDELSGQITLILKK